MHPAFPIPNTSQIPDPGQRVLIEQLADGKWHAALYSRIRRPGDGLLDLDLNPVREWRVGSLKGLVGAVESEVPGVGMLVLVEG